MKLISYFLVMLLALVSLTGCWDREYLKDINLAYSVALDLKDDGKIFQAVEIIIPAEAEQTSTTNEIHTSEGMTTRDASSEMRKKDRGNLSFIKNSIQLIGSPLAKQGLNSVLNVIFRDPNNPTANLRLVVTEGEATKILSQKMVGGMKVGEFISQKIKSLERMSLFYPTETVDTVFRSLKDPGQDFALPYIGQEGKEVVAKGVALFHEHHLTGSLNADQSVMLVLLKGRQGENARFTRKIEISYPDNLHGTMTFNLAKKKIKRKFNVHVSKDGDIIVNLNLKLQAIVEEFTEDQALTEKKLDSINQRLSEMLTEEAKDVIRELQKANCDIFGVGRKVIAYHNNVWKTKNWSKDYPKVQFHTKVDVEIVDTGVIF
ncbi:germination protein, Ger(x)C family [Paenibacillus uliginis N3/975]|uniref:Germination protein, Ger(X)C family n=1 Tax=Paenibacillus uliginis N3/975 TaxID=1313296 RepID=A0A1X7HBU6_9BACL|nr:germination protein, Ger(x)C family [Paenibacillus uliginis N3/975]